MHYELKYGKITKNAPSNKKKRKVQKSRGTRRDRELRQLPLDTHNQRPYENIKWKKWMYSMEK